MRGVEAHFCPFTVVTLQYTCLAERRVAFLRFIAHVTLYKSLHAHMRTCTPGCSDLASFSTDWNVGWIQHEALDLDTCERDNHRSDHSVIVQCQCQVHVLRVLLLTFKGCERWGFRYCHLSNNQRIRILKASANASKDWGFLFSVVGRWEASVCFPGYLQLSWLPMWKHHFLMCHFIILRSHIRRDTLFHDFLCVNPFFENLCSKTAFIFAHVSMWHRKGLSWQPFW